MATKIMPRPSGGTDIRIVACPACGREIEHQRDFPDHLLLDHDPEDFGLSPLWRAEP